MRLLSRLHYRFPWPFQQTDFVSVDAVRRIEVGFCSGMRVYEEALMLTGDENIVEAQMVVQYRVADPSKFLFRLHDPEVTLPTRVDYLESKRLSEGSTEKLLEALCSSVSRKGKKGCGFAVSVNFVPKSFAVPAHDREGLIVP